MHVIVHVHVPTCIPTVDLNVRTDREQLTPFLVAAKYNRKNTVLWLLQDGEGLVDVDAVDQRKRNAIHLAVLNMKCEYTIDVGQQVKRCRDAKKHRNSA